MGAGGMHKNADRAVIFITFLYHRCSVISFRSTQGTTCCKRGGGGGKRVSATGRRFRRLGELKQCSRCRAAEMGVVTAPTADLGGAGGVGFQNPGANGIEFEGSG